MRSMRRQKNIWVGIFTGFQNKNYFIASINGNNTMTYECKVYDKNGKLKKILRESDLSKSSKKLFNQSSTKKITSFINRFKEPALESNKQTKFYNKICVVCQKDFHPRHPNSKYCSHECQKSLYLAKKKEGNPG